MIVESFGGVLGTIGASVGGLLTLASVAARRLSRCGVEKASDLAPRVRTWWLIVLVIGLAMALGPLAWVALLSWVGVQAWEETRALLPGKRMAMMRIVLAASVPISFAAMTFTVPPGAWVGPVRDLTLAVLLIVWMSDTAQYGFGKWLGRTRILPRTSPGKTVEGTVLGGLFATVFGVFLLGSVIGMNWLTAFVVSASLIVVGFLGDVSLSWLKRRQGLKDTGTILPGHGGLLDRIDSLIYAAPLVAILYLSGTI